MADSDRVRTGDRWLPDVSVLAFGAFAVGTDAFVIAGLLPAISDSLSVSVAAAGQMVSVFSIAYAVLSPVLAAFPRTGQIQIHALGDGQTLPPAPMPLVRRFLQACRALG